MRNIVFMFFFLIFFNHLAKTEIRRSLRLSHDSDSLKAQQDNSGKIKNDLRDNVYEHGRGWIRIIQMGEVKSTMQSQKIVYGLVYEIAVVGTMNDLVRTNEKNTKTVMWVWTHELVCVQITI